MTSASPVPTDSGGDSSAKAFAILFRNAVTGSDLKAKQRENLLLFVEASDFKRGVIDGKRNADLAEQMNCSSRTVQRRLVRARGTSFFQTEFNFRRPPDLPDGQRRPTRQRASTHRLRLPEPAGSAAAPPEATHAPRSRPASPDAERQHAVPRPAPPETAPLPQRTRPPSSPSPSATARSPRPMTASATEILYELSQHPLAGLRELATAEEALYFDERLTELGQTSVAPVLDAIRGVARKRRQLAATTGAQDTLRAQIDSFLERVLKEGFGVDESLVLRGTMLALELLRPVVEADPGFAELVLVESRKKGRGFTSTHALLRETVQCAGELRDKALRKHVLTAVRGEITPAAPQSASPASPAPTGELPKKLVIGPPGKARAP